MKLVDLYGLSTRTYNALRRHGIETVDQLLEMSRRELLRDVRNFGAASLEEVVTELDRVGLRPEGWPR